MDKKQKWVALFAARMLVIYVALFAVYETAKAFGLMQPLNELEAQTTFFIIKNFYPNVVLNGNTISSLLVSGEQHNLAITINEICTGYFPIAGFTAMVLGIPKIKKNLKLKSLAMGIPFIFFANIFRLVALTVVAANFGLEALDLFHLIVFKFDMMLIVIMAFTWCCLYVIGEKNILESAGIPVHKSKH